jgi:hypothetical protein
MHVPYLFLIAEVSFPKYSPGFYQILPSLLYEFSEEIMISMALLT